MSLVLRNRLLIVAGTVAFLFMLLIVPPFCIAAMVLGVLVMVFSVGRDATDERPGQPTNRMSMALGGIAFTGGLLALSLLVSVPPR